MEYSQLLQVIRVDYPLPNTGLRYSKGEPGKGEKWWSRQTSTQGTTPEKCATLGAQLGKPAPALHVRTLSRAPSRASSSEGEKVNANVSAKVAGAMCATQRFCAHTA